MNQAAPFFSIIIPTYNRIEQLIACLDSLRDLNYAKDRFEVIIVDDGSEIPPEKELASFTDDLNVKLLIRPHEGPGAARNAGANHALGTYLAFTDDDCRPTSDWLEILESYVVKFPDHLIGGRTVNALPNDVYAQASQILITYVVDYYWARRKSLRFFPSSNLAIPRRRFIDIGGFDTSFRYAGGEDREFCSRWIHSGYQIAYALEAIVHHTHNLNLGDFWGQHLRYGRGAYHFHRIRRQQEYGAIHVEPPSFYIGMLRPAFSRTSAGATAVLLFLLVASQAANALGFFLERIDHSLR